MRNRKVKIFALVMAGCLCLSGLTGCGGGIKMTTDDTSSKSDSGLMGSAKKEAEKSDESEADSADEEDKISDDMIGRYVSQGYENPSFGFAINLPDTYTLENRNNVALNDADIVESSNSEGTYDYLKSLISLGSAVVFSAEDGNTYIELNIQNAAVLDKTATWDEEKNIAENSVMTEEDAKKLMGEDAQVTEFQNNVEEITFLGASFVERKKYSEDGEYSYSVNTLFTFAYEVVGDKLYMGLEALIMDDEDETNLGYHVQDRKDWVEYSYGFDGLDLILSKDGKSTRLRSADILYAEKKNEGLYEWGYAKNSSSGYDGIVHLSLNTEDGDDSYIEWADGRTGENVKTQIDGNQFTLTWDSTYRYNYDLGESEEGEGGKITGIFLITNRPNGGMDGGLSICVDGKWYPYVYDSTAYWNGELSDNLETDADVSSMSEDELGELKENQTAVSSGLMGAFKEQGLDSTKIDESTGTVQMDNNVLFAWDKADLSEEGKAYLDQFLAAYVPVISSAIEDGKVSTIVVEGYTDSAGDEAYNLKLSQERAKTVADYIKAGYPELTNAIEVVGNGANNLILDGEGKEDAAASRRVEVRYVLKTE